MVGRPNVGKSSFINQIIGSERVITHSSPGTTRDAVNIEINIYNKNFLFTDTAGVKKRSNITTKIEKYSMAKVFDSINKADIVFLIIEALEGITSQDVKIVHYIEKKGKGIILVINKWDLIEEKNKMLNFYKEEIIRKFSFVKSIPFLAVSALTGFGIKKIFGLIDEVIKNYSKRILTSQLNKIIQKLINLPYKKTKKILKIFYLTQIAIKPPRFVLFVNYPELINNNYIKYLKNLLYKNFNFSGIPIKIIIRRKK